MYYILSLFIHTSIVHMAALHYCSKVGTPCIQVPLLVPGFQYKYSVDVFNIDEDGGAEPVQVFVCGTASIVPMISAVVNMPLSDIVLDDQAP